MIDYDKLRGALAEKGLTQKDVAFRLGCTPQAVSLKVKGKSAITVREATAICDLLNATADERDAIFFADNVK